jgi:hypothetical protein
LNQEVLVVSRRLGVFASTLVAAVTLASPGRAELTAGADVQLVIPVGEASTNVGWLVGARAGYRFQLRSLSLGPEIGGVYGDYTPVASAQKIVTAFYGGARLGLDFVPVVTPYAFARAGYGVATTTNLPDPNQTQLFSAGAFIDVGLGVTRRLTRFFELGIDAGYTTIEPGHCFCARWVHAGAAGSFTF